MTVYENGPEMYLKDLPDGFKQILSNCLNLNAKKRYQSFRELREDLENMDLSGTDNRTLKRSGHALGDFLSKIIRK